MLNKKEIKLLRKFTEITARTKKVRGATEDKFTLDSINKKYPGVINFFYGGEAVSVGDDRGFVLFTIGDQAAELLEEIDRTAIVGYEARCVDRHGLELRCHFRADSESRFRAQVKRKYYGAVTIVDLEPMTHEVWCSAYGWGKM